MSSLKFSNGKTCLNGWWDFQPIYGENTDPNSPVPQDGWLKSKLLVPSVWTQSISGIRKKGETYFREREDFFKTNEDLRQYEFLFNSFGYPPQWGKTRQAWIRRHFDLAELNPAKRYFINIEAVMPRGVLFVNGNKVATHVHPALPFEADVTSLLQSGKNELAVLVLDHERGADGRPLVPTGNFFIQQHCGIWQDVWLLERDEVYVSDVTIRTSVREKTLWIKWEITNASDRPRHISLRPDVCQWKKGQNPIKAVSELDLPESMLVIAPHSVAKAQKTVVWKDPLLWQPGSPNLYILRTSLVHGDRKPSLYTERFGFRELWIEGPHLMLNGYPVHGFSDWGHKATPYFLTENWIRQWYGMIRDANMNHTRLHAFPHPPLNMDLADEMGILVTGETGLYGSGGKQGRDEPAFWEASADHLRRLIRRDKNHPSIILWSVENEMRWNHGTTRLMLDELPKLRQRCNELDPTRFAYHEGDSSLWNENQQPIISRHYDKISSGVGWWDRSRPLHSGEISLYHYASANNTSHLAGDAAWKSLKAADEAAAQDTAWIVEGGRALGVCNFGPWNLSCLENLRLEKKQIRPKYQRFESPGMKPLIVNAHTAEFEFWKKGKGYTPNYSFKIQAHAFRPVAVLDNNRRQEYFAGHLFSREISIVNDSTGPIKGKVEILLTPQKGGRAPVCKIVRPVNVKRGFVQTLELKPKLSAKLATGPYIYAVQLKDHKGKLLDGWKRAIRIHGQSKEATKIQCEIAVYGPGSISKALTRLGIKHRYVESITAEKMGDAQLLILEKNTVQPGATINKEVRAFAQRGGRVLILEQENSIFPKMAMEPKPLQTSWVRGYAHPVLRDFTDENFTFWGDAPYPKPGADSAVAEHLYVKNGFENYTVLLDGDQGSFGVGGLRFATLIETKEGPGHILACQLLITSRIETIPSAQRLLMSMLVYLENPAPASPENDLSVVDGQKLSAAEIKDILSQARDGKTLLLDSPSKAVLQKLRRPLGLKLETVQNKPEYQVVRTGSHPELCGISNEDVSGVEQWSYAPPKNKDVIVGATWLKPEKKLKALLVTPTESCLKELSHFDGKTELLRAHVFSRFLHSEKPKEYVAMGAVKHGKGRIVINLFNPAEPRDRFTYSRSRLLANLGQEMGGSLLEGECVPKSELSQGFPTFVHVMNREADGDLRKGLVESTAIRVEHIGNEPIMGYSGWRQRKNDEGIFTAADLDTAKPVFFYFKVISRVPRKELSSNLGIPNPEQLTFLEMQGDGGVQVTINATSRPAVSFENGKATAADIPLEQGANHVLIEWKPVSNQSTIQIRWRDINGRPETKLRFG